MRKSAIAVAFASTVLATPAVARDGASYIGVEGGLMLVQNTELNYADESVAVNDGLVIKHDTGFDADLIGGHDFGMFRLEAEAGYKHASLDRIRPNPTADLVDAPAGTKLYSNGHAGVLSAMLNGLLDFGDDDGWRGYAGAGVGLARVKYKVGASTMDFSVSDRAFAWQAIAGISKEVTPNVDFGLKYRYFNTRRLNFGNDDAVVPFTLNGKFRSHSLLASLTYNLWTPAAPAPVVVETAAPPPPPPATQTCPDGSVILATDTCPVPPPPPPPPAPEPERG